jgi:hypothetical protein
MSPQAQAQMGPPGGPGFGEGIGQAQQQQGKSPVEIALGTVEKILMGIQDETMRPYVQKALATLKIGASMVAAGGPQSQGMNKPPNPNAPPGGPGGPPPGPPVPGPMPG